MMCTIPTYYISHGCDFSPERTEGGLFVLTNSEPAMWVKISSSWVCMLIYVWTLIAPLIMRNRDFD